VPLLALLVASVVEAVIEVVGASVAWPFAAARAISVGL
jgi:hypothetical protein